MSLIKALLLGAVLNLIVSGAIHAGGSGGGYLNIGQVQIAGHYIHWSWPLFVAAAGMIWGILLLMK